MTTADFDYVRHFVRGQAAIVLEPGKEYLVESRLLTLSRRENIPTVDELVARLRASPGSPLHRKVIDAMTTNETSFFRDIHPFETLRKHVLPELIARRAAHRQLTIWCGAASTGQEPFTLMMVIAEHFPDLLHWNLRFVATDLSAEVLARARSGRFTQLEVNRGLPAAMLVKYFTRQGNEWEFRENLRRKVEFREMNLVADWAGLPQLDLILLRNVLIYFDLETKKAILAKARRLLRPDSYLMLGGAETTFNIDDAFERVVLDKTICYRVSAAASASAVSTPADKPAMAARPVSSPARDLVFLAPTALAAPL